MERAEVPAKPEWRCRAGGSGGKVELEVGRWVGMDCCFFRAGFVGTKFRGEIQTPKWS